MIPRFLESRDEALMRSANWFTSTFRVHLCLRRLAGGNLHSGRIRIPLWGVRTEPNVSKVCSIEPHEP